MSSRGRARRAPVGKTKENSGVVRGKQGGPPLSRRPWPGATCPPEGGAKGSERYQPAFPAEYREKWASAVETPESDDESGTVPLPPITWSMQSVVDVRLFSVGMSTHLLSSELNQ